MCWICGTTTRSCATLSSTMCTMTNSTSQTTVSCRPQFSFGLFSCPFLHPCSSIIPTLHHFVLTTTHLLSVILYPFQHIARVHPRRPSDLANSFFSIVGLVLRQSLVGHKLELFTVVPLVLFVVHESGGDSIKSLSCFSTIFLGSSTQTTWSSRFVRSHLGSSHFLFERARCLSRARASLVLFLSKCLQPSFDVFPSFVMARASDGTDMPVSPLPASSSHIGSPNGSLLDLEGTGYRWRFPF